MMVSRKFFLSLTAAIALLVEAVLPEAGAMPIHYLTSSRGPILQARLPLASIGSLKLPNGQLVLIDNNVQIQAIPEALFDSRTVLSGVVLKAEAEPAASTSQTIRALVYFYSGTWLSYLGPAPISELVETGSGKILSGRIIEGDNQSLSLSVADGKTVSIDMRDIANLRSPRAFWLDIPVIDSRALTQAGTSFVGQASSAVFKPTFGSANVVARRSVIRPNGDETGISKAAFAAYLLADIAAFVGPAIALPLAIEKRNLTTKNKYKAFNQAGEEKDNQIDALQSEVDDLKSAVGALSGGKGL